MTTNSNKDKPSVHFSFSQFEDVELEPFVYMTKDNKRVVFPDIFAMDADEGETLLRDMESNRVTLGEGLKRWLSKDDLAKVEGDRLTLRQRMALVEAAQSHYEKFYGDAGEGSASAS